MPWLRRARNAALARFALTGYPTLRDEDWKYTSVAQIEAGRFSFVASSQSLVTPDQIEALALAGAHVLVFVNGHHVPALSHPGALAAGVTLASLAELLEREPQRLRGLWPESAGELSDSLSGFSALNAACAADGAYVELAPGAVLAEPIQLLFITREANLATHCRNVVVAGAGSRACIVEHHAALGTANYFSNTVTELVIGAGAEIEHHKLQDESPAAFHFAAVHAELAEHSRWLSGSFALGGALARTDIRATLNAEGANCTLDGLYMGSGRRHVDHHTRIDHAKPHGTSREFYKGVLDGASRAVFNGRVVVHPGAQHSDAFQSNRNLLLSENAEVDTKPQLEIYADDVQCSHGATVGQLDADQIFYLRSRGIADAAARAVLTFAFAAEMVERVRLAPLRERLDSLLRARLPALMEA
ncbi:MAG: Fe-S cluster assembly protein SufD [Nevskiaceae bacterium]